MSFSNVYGLFRRGNFMITMDRDGCEGSSSERKLDSCSAIRQVWYFRSLAKRAYVGFTPPFVEDFGLHFVLPLLTFPHPPFPVPIMLQQYFGPWNSDNAISFWRETIWKS